MRPQNAKANKGPILAATGTFTLFSKINTDVSQRWVPSVEEDVLCIDVSEPGQVVTSNRTGRTRAEVDVDEWANKKTAPREGGRRTDGLAIGGVNKR